MPLPSHWIAICLRQPCRSAIVLVMLAALVPAAAASTTNGDRQHSDIRLLQQAADVYAAELGRHPITDESGTWFQKMAAWDPYSFDDLHFGTTADGSLPIDCYGQPLVYEVVGGSAVVRTIGRDGIDNHGGGDDLDSRYGSNIGHWNKAGWPKLFAFMGVAGLLTLLGGWIARLGFRRVLPAAAALLLMGGVLVGIVIGAYFRCGFFETSASRWPGWTSTVALYSILGFPAAALLFAIDWLKRLGRDRPALRGLCPTCGYDLRGGASRGCPECGWKRERAGSV